MIDCLPHIHGLAMHGEAQYANAEQRSFTPGLGVLCRYEDFLAGVGRLRNSQARMSNYAALGWQPIKAYDVRMGAFVGRIDGYAFQHGGSSLWGGLIASKPVPWGEAHLMFTPRVSGQSAATFEISTTIRF